MPVVSLAYSSIVHAVRMLYEFKDFRSWRTGSKNCFDACAEKFWSVFMRNDSSTKDDNILKAFIHQQFAHFWKEMAMGSGKR